jgi:hypothetical protein
MDVTFADKLGTEDRQILGVSIVDGELQLQLDKPESLGWQELIYFIKYVIAEALAEESELAAGDVFQWLGAQGDISDEVETKTRDILQEARQKRLQDMMLNEKLRLDQVDR